MRTFIFIFGLFIGMTMALDAYGQSFPQRVEILVTGRPGSTLYMLGEKVAATLNKSRLKKNAFTVKNLPFREFVAAIKRGGFAKTDGSQLAIMSTPSYLSIFSPPEKEKADPGCNDRSFKILPCSP